MENRCRLCAELSPNHIPILEDLEFCSRVFDLFQIKVSISDLLPTCACLECYDTVEKTWHFNDRIQKAQDVLTELAQTVNILQSPENKLEVPTMLDTQTEFPNDSSVIELQYTTTKNIVKCDYLPAGSELSEDSDKSEPKQKISTCKNKTKKNSKRKSNIDDSDGLNELDFNLDSDGSMIPKKEAGWDAYPWSCCECQMIFISCDDLQEHFLTVHNSTARYLCVDCPKIYSKRSIFITHVKAHRPGLKHCCDICYKWFPTAGEQTRHRLGHADDRQHECGTCGKKFRMQSALLVHVRSHLPAEIKNRYQCDQCPKKFGTKPNLTAHKRIHTGIRDYTCDQCGKSFVQKGNLDNHLLTHTAARPFSCEACGKSFKTMVRLRKHGSVHSGLKPHRCDVCGRGFRERGTLKEHVRIHTGAMPFACEFCGKCFRFKGVLTTHRRQHTGERPYSCNECQHHFTNWPNYNKHMKRRHGINTSVTCRTRQDIPPTGMPHRNPPGTVLAPPQPAPLATDTYVESSQTFYPVLSLYNIPDELLQARV